MKSVYGSVSFFTFFFLFFLFLSTAVFPADESGGRGDFDIAAGDIKVTLHRETGTFSFYKLRSTGKNRYDPLLDTRNYGAGTCFSVSVNGRTYVLEKKAFRRIGFEVSEDEKEASFIFTPGDNFQVRQRFFIEENTAFGQPAFVLAIETSIENTSDAVLSVAWRVLFDTMLGETRSSSVRGHFSTDSGQAINSETLITSPQPRFLFSSNGERTCTFSFAEGLQGPNLDSVYIANWNRCDSLLRGSFSRAIDCVEGRSLSSVYAPNDSAVLASWREITLNRGETASVTVFLSALDPQSVAAAFESSSQPSSSLDSERELSDTDAAEMSDDERLFNEKQALYVRVMDRLRQIESGSAIPETGEIDELNRILDFLLEDSYP